MTSSLLSTATMFVPQASPNLIRLFNAPGCPFFRARGYTQSHRAPCARSNDSLLDVRLPPDRRT
ncbi:uncharacterized protein M421DRAFT_424402 [Didymella exigua CBS 183.55]|uniref:Uncharacterized protein n=1 Tax=Didymella exigua CBS 183.55 TaxID=1150837 RepID=A0A6A5RAW0_9PLEO|nr:uncharacterized protein M421DRAFT_424402 [Didymella exigua CBS 183.55]KAF1924762.1 hypothetical protein M421DRAFT_424402 [Didymella exigua CBS 183.55]